MRGNEVSQQLAREELVARVRRSVSQCTPAFVLAWEALALDAWLVARSKEVVETVRSALQLSGLFVTTMASLLHWAAPSSCYRPRL